MHTQPRGPQCILLSICRQVCAPITPHLVASFEWISFITGNTPTHGFVAGWVAFGKSSTGVLKQARVDTVTIETHLSVSVVIVTLASLQPWYCFIP